MEYFQCNYILSLAIFFAKALIREYIIQHQHMKDSFRNPITISLLVMKHFFNQSFHVTFFSRDCRVASLLAMTHNPLFTML